eukprot:CAMPEP_0202813566 /NCGR_PEP_ID=MMETSP1389-20130828/4891_1 /ASSEMBLY_ACC=CAM_ASM_000865 /TAXON_ID=302021 /ORGANISM="Rhodomonas sp., Strain CCMP768" /LENGTH=90 /DNA_ID=CAMNT_0049485175 /DNA_START=180 /DNA_END=452 /DNA_ORIENTATION=-
MSIAVFLIEGKTWAIDATCPHQGGKLELGDIEDGGGRPNVLCPRHGWCFRLKDGYCEDISNYGVSAYETVVLSDGSVCVSQHAVYQPPIE